MLLVFFVMVGSEGLLADQQPLQLVEDVDLERYQGRWYEIARLPNRFQSRCDGNVSAFYELQDNGRLEVINRCRAEGGGIRKAVGEARRPDPERPAALEVRFAPAWLSLLPWVWGDYQIMALSGGYEWALVGAPSRRYLWILAREPELAEGRVQDLLEEARRQGFETDAVMRTPHYREGDRQ